MRSKTLILLALAVGGMSLPFGAVKDTVATAREEAEFPRFLVHLNCDPDDDKAVTATLKLASSLAGEKSRVTLFVDLRAVVLAARSAEQSQATAREKYGKSLDSLRAAGVRILVCPHCAERAGITSDRLRKGFRFTNKDELAKETEAAERVFESPPADVDQPPGDLPPTLRDV